MIKGSKSQKELEKHVQKLHREGQKRLKCDICFINFGTKFNLASHKQEKHTKEFEEQKKNFVKRGRGRLKGEVQVKETSFGKNVGHQKICLYCDHTGCSH